MPDIFISYKREDKKKAEFLANKLIASGWSVWWDHDLLGGDDYDVVIERELSKAKAVIVIWTALSISSRNVKDEARKAVNRNILVPVSFDKTEPPIGFGMVHTIQIKNSTAISDDEFAKLCQSVLKKIENKDTSNIIDPPKPPSKKYYYILSGVIILLIAFFIINRNIKPQLTPEQLKNYNINMELASFFRDTDRLDQALACYEEAKKIAGDTPEVIEAIKNIQKQIGGNSK